MFYLVFPNLLRSVNLLVCVVFGCKVVSRHSNVFVFEFGRQCVLPQILFAMCMESLGRVNVLSLRFWILASSVHLLYCLVVVVFGCSSALPQKLLKC